MTTEILFSFELNGKIWNKAKVFKHNDKIDNVVNNYLSVTEFPVVKENIKWKILYTKP